MLPTSIGGVAGASLPTPGPSAPSRGASFGAVLEARGARLAAPGTDPSPRGLAAAARSGLESIERAQARLDGLLEAARSGRTFTPQELLGLQASAYRYAQVVELGGRLVEQGAQAVKQALQAQV